MRLRLRTWATLALLSMVFIGLWLFFRPTGTYQTLTCERHELAHNGQPVIGVEDMAYDVQQNRIYISAYDRRSNAEGGLYRFSPQNFETIEKLKTPSPVTTPHGFTLNRDGEHLSLTVIDRNLGNPKKQSAKIRRFEWQDSEPKISEIALPQNEALFCNANNLAALTNKQNGAIEYFVTADHKVCTYNGRKRENIFAPRSAHLVKFDTENNRPIKTVTSQLNFANGIAILPHYIIKEDYIYIAETRKKRISVFADTKDGFELRYWFRVSGGPDNITVTDTEYLWVATHPNLVKFAAYRAGLTKHAPSRIEHLQTGNRSNEYLEHNVYDIPADIISGATVVLQADRTLFLGAAYDTAIAQCKIPESPT